MTTCARLMNVATGALLVLLTACAHELSGYPVQPATVSAIDHSILRVDLVVQWYTSVDEVHSACATANESPGVTLYGCSYVTRMRDGGVQCLLRVMPPRDFNDVPRLAVLGHELAHCYNMRHLRRVAG